MRGGFWANILWLEHWMIGMVRRKRKLQRQGPGYRGSWMLSKWLCTEFWRHCRITEGFRWGSWSLMIILESGSKSKENANKWLNFILVITKDPCFCVPLREVKILDINLSIAWRIPGTGEPGGLPSMGSYRVGHDWSDLAAVAAAGWYHLGDHRAW